MSSSFKTSKATKLQLRRTKNIPDIGRGLHDNPVILKQPIVAKSREVASCFGMTRSVLQASHGTVGRTKSVEVLKLSTTSPHE